MATYTALDDVRYAVGGSERLKELTDDEGRNTVNTQRVEVAITSGANLIEAYIGGRYGLPLPEPVPGLVKDMNTQLAAYNLYQRRLDIEMPGATRQRYTDAMALLRDVRDGGADLYAIASDTLTPGIVLSNVRPALFGADLLRRM